jgi:hypothetical protein
MSAESRIVPGAVVQPPKGSPLMRVENVLTLAGGTWAACSWSLPSGTVQFGFFRPDELEVVETSTKKGGAKRTTSL